MTKPHVIVIDHSTGAVAFVGDDRRSQAELATALMEQARSTKTAAVGAPPPRRATTEPHHAR